MALVVAFVAFLLTLARVDCVFLSRRLPDALPGPPVVCLLNATIRHSRWGSWKPSA
jgi:hypothetical protein